MGIVLYPHNECAYRAVEKMLEEHGRAAVIHPTGTGKSFIAFKYVERHAQMRTLWLSPSEYIFKTQLMSIEREAAGESFAQLQFMTYAKLMMRMQDELQQEPPELIILDEFHRCGADHWGDGVARLLAAAPRAKVLGLSATSIRYLDNQRDMAQELFGGNVASEMSLGEAIVRGILPEPKYVTTVFRYQKELTYFEKRIKAERPGMRRAHEERLLQALRRALEKADGLDEIFQRHVRKGEKYIVFCANVEHLQEMHDCIHGWFSRVDSAPHCYTVYADHPETKKEFARFLADDSEHLKLLLSIDMLNEGIHVPGVSGVILFRPTISPIIYKQQIGRALTAGDSGMPVIIDVVNNMENLLSIGALQEEMLEAAKRMRENGEGARIVTERFEVIDQVKDCREIFAQLQSSLNSDWEQYFAQARRYADEHGSLNVPKNHTTPDGLNLGQWIGIQRKVRAGRQAGRLTQEQIDRLDAIGMIWENRLETAWERGYAYAKAYYEEHGNLLVPAKYVTEDGYGLGAWIRNLRQRVQDEEMRSVLTQERIRRLNEIGMKWDGLSAKWEENYLEAMRYFLREGNLRVPAGYKTESGFALGAWIRNLRNIQSGVNTQNRPLSKEQIRRLEAIGMVWENSYEGQWLAAYEAAKRYFAQNGHLNIPAAYVSPEGIALGKWIRRQRDAERRGKLSAERQRMLNAMDCQEALAGD